MTYIHSLYLLPQLNAVLRNRLREAAFKTNSIAGIMKGGSPGFLFFEGIKSRSEHFAKYVEKRGGEGTRLLLRKEVNRDGRVLQVHLEDLTRKEAKVKRLEALTSSKQFLWRLQSESWLKPFAEELERVQKELGIDPITNKSSSLYVDDELEEDEEMISDVEESFMVDVMAGKPATTITKTTQGDKRLVRMTTQRDLIRRTVGR